MNRAAVALMAAIAAAAASAAQTPASSSRPAPAGHTAPPAQGRGGRGGPPIVSPQVNPDRTVTLRFRAPNARSVELIGEIEGKPFYPMTDGPPQR